MHEGHHGILDHHKHDHDHEHSHSHPHPKKKTTIYKIAAGVIVIIGIVAYVLWELSFA